MTEEQIIRELNKAKVKAGESFRELSQRIGLSKGGLITWFEGRVSPKLGTLVDMAGAYGYEVVLLKPGAKPWRWTADHLPVLHGVYFVAGHKRDGGSYQGYAVYYPDGKWYTTKGRPMPAPDKWLDDKPRPWVQTMREGDEES